MNAIGRNAINGREPHERNTTNSPHVIGETMEECMKRLQSFGITAAAIPKSPQENEYQTKLLQSRRNLEGKRKESKVEDVESTDQQNPPCDDFGEWVCGPSKYDVILGRGQKCNLHPGNVRLRKLVDEAKHLYEQSEKREKGVMIARMVQAIQQQGRFLHESDIGWAEVTDKVARQKVSHTFRDAGKRKKGKRRKNNKGIVDKGRKKRKR